MAKNKSGIEKGDILVSLGLAYIYKSPEDAVLDLEVDKAPSNTRFGVFTGVSKVAKDGFSYTEFVTYSSGIFDLTDTKYYVLQSTYTIEENKNYDYSKNLGIFGSKPTTTTTGGTTGFNKFLDLLTGIFTVFQSKKTDNTATDTTNTDGTDTSGNTTSNGNSGQTSWLAQNKFTVIIGAIVVFIGGVMLYISSKNKKKAQLVKQPQAITPTTAV